MTGGTVTPARGEAEKGTSGLADRQAELVAALVSGAPLPPGFDADRVAVARHALLRKRAGEVARAWPALAASRGAGWPAAFTAWAAGRAPQGSLRDGWDFARHLAAADSGLAAGAAEELAIREAGWRYDGHSPPRPRRMPVVRRAPGAAVVQIAGRIHVFRTPGGAA